MEEFVKGLCNFVFNKQKFFFLKYGDFFFLIMALSYPLILCNCSTVLAAPLGYRSLMEVKILFFHCPHHTNIPQVASFFLFFFWTKIKGFFVLFNEVMILFCKFVRKFGFENKKSFF